MKAYNQHEDTNRREEVLNQYQVDMRHHLREANEENQHTSQWGGGLIAFW